MHPGQVAFGNTAVPIQRLSDQLLLCQSPRAHTPGFVSVTLAGCQARPKGRTAAFEYVERIEALYDRIFCKTNSFCPYVDPRDFGDTAKNAEERPE